MTHAYQEIYLSKAQATLGDAFDYAVNTCKMNGSDFTKLFIASSVSKRMENGEPAYLAGKSGIEIVLEVVYETMGKHLQVEPQEHMGRSREYWIGWVAAYYQWHSGRKYSDIFKVISFEDMQKMYYTLHEADITKFVETADKLMKEHFADTGPLCQLCLGATVGGADSLEVCVSEVFFQMYEQRNKDINKASVETVYSLAKVLGCAVEDLIERQGTL